MLRKRSEPSRSRTRAPVVRIRLGNIAERPGANRLRTAVRRFHRVFRKKVTDLSQGARERSESELFPRGGFILTNLPIPNRAVVPFYNKRDTAEPWIKEGKQRPTAAHARRQMSLSELTADARDSMGQARDRRASALVEWTADGHLRHRAFLGLRVDKTAKDVRQET